MYLSTLHSRDSVLPIHQANFSRINTILVEVVNACLGIFDLGINVYPYFHRDCIFLAQIPH